MRRVLTALVIAFFAVLLVYLTLRWYLNRPTTIFCNLVADPIPESVRNIHVSGYTALAGSDEIVSFELSPKDFPKILAKRAFIKKSVQELINRDKMQKMPFLPSEEPIYYEASELDGLVTFTIKTNASKSFVYYRYIKI